MVNNTEREKGQKTRQARKQAKCVVNNTEGKEAGKQGRQERKAVAKEAKCGSSLKSPTRTERGEANEILPCKLRSAHRFSQWLIKMFRTPWRNVAKCGYGGFLLS